MAWLKRSWVDLVVALVLAIVLFNVHVSTAGDALWSVSRPDRHLLYVGVALLGAMFMIAAIRNPSLQGLQSYRSTIGAFGFTIVVSLASVLLDVQDGPVRTIQLLFEFALFFGLLTGVRFALVASKQTAASTRN